MSKSGLGFGASELFIYSRLEPVRVIDLEHRLSRAGVPADAEGRRLWARAVLAEDRQAVTPDDLAVDYASHLRMGRETVAGLPSRTDLREAESFDGAAIARSEAYRGDVQRAERRFLALALDPSSDPESRQKAARLLQFVERFPGLAQANAPGHFAPVLTRRSGPAAAPNEAAPSAPGDDPGAAELGELSEMVEAVEALWRARDAHVARLHDSYQALRRERGKRLRAVHDAQSATAAKAPRSKAATKATAKAAARSPVAQGAAVARREIAASIESARKAWQAARSNTAIANMLATGKSTMVESTLAAATTDIDTVIARLDDLVRKHKLPVDGFCQLLAAVLDRMDQVDRTRLAPPAYSQSATQARWDAPRVQFTDSVQMLGKAELVRVEEEFVSYSAAEISYVQTAMPGERRQRKTRSAHLQETVLEQLDDTLRERSDETSSGTKTALRSEIESELRSRFDSNLSVSGSGQGGGSVGLVNFSGGGSASAGLGLGVDTGIRSNTEMQFSQEILRKAVERTSQRTIERRVTRAMNSFSASDTHEITNATSTPINGTYVFLNKHIAVTETVYGVRAFLEAKLLMPGRSLVSARQSRQQAVIDEIGERPRFDITPDQITPANYMRLAGRFRAANVEPPPPPVSRLTRVYKTDSAASTSATDSFNGGKIAEVLVPFFGRYQRFAITDNVDLPEGYGVLDVDVAVSHGANGVSLPAHLPLTLPGTAIYAATSFMPFAMGLLGIAFLPAWVWSVAFAASPILHYNTDSSNVTVTIGTQGQDSAYFFFEPDDLLEIVMDLLRAISAASPQLLQSLQTLATQRIAEMRTAAALVPVEIASRVGDAINAAIDRIYTILDKLAQADLAGAAADVLTPASVDLSLANIDELDDVFAPLTGFVGDLTGLVQDEIGDAIQLALSEVLSRLENNQRMDFAECRGAEGKLPIAINALAIHPGVTVTVSACLMRTREGLARWQLRTFEAIYQAYLQQLAAWESQFYSSAPRGLARAPALMRRDERVALKERVIAALDALHPSAGPAIAIERLELFEHAIDWESLSYRLYDYGPSEAGLALENSSVLAGADEERRRFLLASWAQVMLPLQPHEGLAAQFFDYLGGGVGRVADAISDDPASVPETDELTALYRDLVLSRSLIGDNPPPGEPRFMTLPTDLVALFEPNLAANLPRNPNWP